MNESFQIIATLVAAQLVLGMAQACRAPTSADLPDRALAAILGRWPFEVLWAGCGLAALGFLRTLAPDEVLTALRLICGGHLALLGAVAVRRSFAVQRPTEGAAGRLRAVFTDPGTVLAYLSLFVTTGAGSLADGEQTLVVLVLPTLTFAWNLMVARANAPRRAARPRRRARRDRRNAAALRLRLQPVVGRG